MSFASGSSSSGAKTGNSWRYEIYFDPEADKTSSKGYNITDDELKAKLSELLDAKETIIEVKAFKHPLTWLQATKAVFYHEFIVFRTGKYYWSIEKHGDVITLQRSERKTAVKKKYRHKARFEGWSGISKIKYASGRKSIKDLIEWLYLSNKLNEPYHWLTSNCQEFAETVYRFMT